MVTHLIKELNAFLETQKFVNLSQETRQQSYH
jgi:hypothetical protein